VPLDQSVSREDGWMQKCGWENADDKLRMEKCGWKNADDKMQMKNFE